MSRYSKGSAATRQQQRFRAAQGQLKIVSSTLGRDPVTLHQGLHQWEAEALIKKLRAEQNRADRYATKLRITK